MDLKRINAASHISRWRGWTNRPYSILEHMVVGVEVMADMGMPVEDQRWFLLHDMHETEIIGDVPTPDKMLYCNTLFHAACQEFDNALMSRQRVPVRNGRVVKAMDKDMMIVEHHCIASRRYDDFPALDVDNAVHLAIHVRLEWPQGDVRRRWLTQAARLGVVV